MKAFAERYEGTSRNALPLDVGRALSPEEHAVLKLQGLLKWKLDFDSKTLGDYEARFDKRRRLR